MHVIQTSWMAKGKVILAKFNLGAELFGFVPNGPTFHILLLKSQLCM